MPREVPVVKVAKSGDTGRRVDHGRFMKRAWNPLWPKAFYLDLGFYFVFAISAPVPLTAWRVTLSVSPGGIGKAIRPMIRPVNGLFHCVSQSSDVLN